MNSDQTVLIIGGSGGGLGRGLATHYRRLGAALVLADVNAASLETLASGLRREGGRIVTSHIDVTEPASVEAAFHAARAEFGQVDLVVNTAAVAHSRPTWNQSVSDWRWIYEVNVMGAVNVNRAAIPHMIERGFGHIAHTSSTVVFCPRPSYSIYDSSKAAVLVMCESLQHELTQLGTDITVSVIFPGAIRGGMADSSQYRDARYGPPRVGADESSRTKEYLDHVGADPAIVAGTIADQLAERRFYVFGRPEDVELRDVRGHDISAGRGPSIPDLLTAPGPGSRAAAEQAP